MSAQPQVMRLRHPKALEVKEISDLFERAINASELLPQFSPAIKEELSQALALPNVGFFVGMETNEFRGVVLVALPNTALMGYPQVLHFYTGRADRGGASSALRKALTQAVVDFMGESGYTTFRAICPYTTPRKINAWKRLFRKAGAATELGRIVEFKTK